MTSVSVAKPRCDCVVAWLHSNLASQKWVYRLNKQMLENDYIGPPDRSSTLCKRLAGQMEAKEVVITSLIGRSTNHVILLPPVRLLHLSCFHRCKPLPLQDAIFGLGVKHGHLRRAVSRERRLTHRPSSVHIQSNTSSSTRPLPSSPFGCNYVSSFSASLVIFQFSYLASNIRN